MGIMLSPSTLLKKTKQEIIDEYNRLASQIEGARDLAQAVHDPKRGEIVQSALQFTPDTVISKISDLKREVGGELDALAEKLITASKTFSQLQEAIAYSRDQLQHFKNIQTGAEALDLLIREHDLSKRKLETEYAARKQELDDTIAAAKRQWEREQEEYQYGTELKTRRAKSELQEELAKEQQTLTDRETALKSREDTVKQQEQEIAAFPKRMEIAMEEARKQTTRDLEERFAEQMKLVKKEHENELGIAGLKTAHAEAMLKTQAADIAKLRAELERSAAQVQAMATKIIESSGMVKRENAPESPAQ